jgi:oligopeptide transport system ATP-binding protein
MYAGKIVEYGTAKEVFYDPRHPYTWGLMSSMPLLNDGTEALHSIAGTPPQLLVPPKGDAFTPRNEFALKVDEEYEPPFFQVSDTHYAATWLLDPRAPKTEPPEAVQKIIQEHRGRSV